MHFGVSVFKLEVGGRFGGVKQFEERHVCVLTPAHLLGSVVQMVAALLLLMGRFEHHVVHVVCRLQIQRGQALVL